MEDLVEYNGMYFDKRAPLTVKDIIVRHLEFRGKRLRFWYGDSKTGESWDEENDVTGYIGKSTGTKPIPLLIQRRNSMGGGALMTGCIVKIVDTKTHDVLYKHPTFNQPTFSLKNADVFDVVRNEKQHARFGNKKSAQRYVDFMNGKRMSK